ncbi:hypothetical protein HY412_00050 [Candidatus Kaiserbacteria bacterium]|nr:hypothetical protein [Candidatus Kaiserbacteria bacterium]
MATFETELASCITVPQGVWGKETKVNLFTLIVLVLSGFFTVLVSMVCVATFTLTVFQGSSEIAKTGTKILSAGGAALFCWIVIVILILSGRDLSEAVVVGVITGFVEFGASVSLFNLLHGDPRKAKRQVEDK